MLGEAPDGDSAVAPAYPVALGYTFDGVDAALGAFILPSATGVFSLSNSLPYCLAACVYSNDLEWVWAFADRVEAGAVGINISDATELQAPFGGWKISGLGRELGRGGLKTYLEQRHVRMRVRPLRGDARGEQPTPED